MGGQLAGPLLIGASTTIADFLLPQLIGRFKATHPGVAPSLFVGNSEAVQERLGERALDIGFIEGDSYLPCSRPSGCASDELQVVCAPGHPLAGRSRRRPAPSSQHAYLSREQGSGTREVIDHYLQRAGIEPGALHGIMEASSPEALKGLVATGHGLRDHVACFRRNEIRLGQLVQIPLSPPLTRQLTASIPGSASSRGS